MTPRLPNIHVLLVEDQPIIAMDIESILEENGAARTDTASSTSEAFTLLAAATPDVAILDFHLRLNDSLPVAEELATRNIPFIFTTGYGDNSMIPAKFAHVPIVAKPYDAEILIEVLARIIAESV